MPIQETKAIVLPSHRLATTHVLAPLNVQNLPLCLARWRALFAGRAGLSAFPAG